MQRQSGCLRSAVETTEIICVIAEGHNVINYRLDQQMLPAQALHKAQKHLVELLRLLTMQGMAASMDTDRLSFPNIRINNTVDVIQIDRRVVFTVDYRERDRRRLYNVPLIASLTADGGFNHVLASQAVCSANSFEEELVPRRLLSQRKFHHHTYFLFSQKRAASVCHLRAWLEASLQSFEVIRDWRRTKYQRAIDWRIFCQHLKNDMTAQGMSYGNKPG
ncbi:hypothetical protein AGROH133_10821 [Agrobacterium tumefaciens]|nr:hypothetical protein AGROH133_10821 [Agrobacterium tumefaciens]